MDTAGQEKYRSITTKFIQNSKIVILVYSIIDRKSFENLDYWLNKVKDCIGSDGYVLGIAANKNDLYANAVVKDSEGKAFADKNKVIFAKTSVKENSGIEQLVEELVNKYVSL